MSQYRERGLNSLTRPDRGRDPVATAPGTDLNIKRARDGEVHTSPRGPQSVSKQI
jgi:hypothetical protein